MRVASSRTRPGQLIASAVSIADYPIWASSELILAVPSRSYPHTFALYTEYHATAPDKLGACGSSTRSPSILSCLYTSQRLYVLVPNIAFDAGDELALRLLVRGMRSEEPE